MDLGTRPSPGLPSLLGLQSVDFQDHYRSGREKKMDMEQGKKKNPVLFLFLVEHLASENFT